MDTVRWDLVEEGLQRARERMIWRPYGYPQIVDPSHTAFHDGEIQSAWSVPDRIVVQSAITGAFFTRDANPKQPITPAEILEQARQCVLAGASAIHLHVRDDAGYNTLDISRFQAVVEPLRAEFPDIFIDGCYVCALDGEWAEMKRGLKLGLLDAVPINTAATYTGDALFAKPIPVILEKTRLVLDSGALPIVAVYTDADVNNADRYLFRSGLLGEGQVWCVLPGLPGGSPMENPFQMVDGLLRMVRLINDTDPSAKILICAAGRASSFLATVAATLGLNVRVGMEDTVWRWPHRDEKLDSNLDAFVAMKSIVEGLGRDVVGHADYRSFMGFPALSRAS
jgi:3-keto-5-aminohexanoate cleavage enzyme